MHSQFIVFLTFCFKTTIFKFLIFIKQNLISNFIQVPAFFREPVHNQSVVVGDKATVECPVEGDNPIKVTWLRNEKALQTDDNFFKVKDFCNIRLA
jgi:hypothetical protein